MEILNTVDQLAMTHELVVLLAPILLKVSGCWQFIGIKVSNIRKGIK